MSDNPSEIQSLAQVAHVLDRYRLVINRGSNSGIRKDQRFLIFGRGGNIADPVTEKPLGRLEIVRGTGRVTHVQDLIATIETDMSVPGRKITRAVEPYRSPTEIYLSLMSPKPKAETITETEPPTTIQFDGAEIGDFARPI